MCSLRRLGQQSSRKMRLATIVIGNANSVANSRSIPRLTTVNAAEHDVIYTNIGDILIACNPFKMIANLYR